MHLPPSFIILCLLVQKYHVIVLTNKQTARSHIFWGAQCAPRGAVTPKFELGRDVCTMHLPQVSSSYVYSFGSYRVDKRSQTPLKTSNVLRYATTLGNNFISHATTKMEKSAAPVRRMSRNRTMLTNWLLYLILSLLCYLQTGGFRLRD